jgi:hypothetical protein
MMGLPNDELGRFWVRARWTEEPAQEKQIFATLSALNEDDELSILGNAFVVLANGSSAVCLGAAHSFEKAKQIQLRRKPTGHFNVPPDFRAKGPEYIAADQVHACFLIEEEPIVCRIDQINFIGGYDVAVFTVVAPEERKIFTSRAAIDLSAPRVGDEIAVLANHITHTPSVGEGELELRFDLLMGIVTEVVMGPSALPGQSFYFRTTIPITGGMSGAPVLHKPVVGRPAIARGVISSDFSQKEAFDSYLIAGDSTATMLWPAMGLGLNVAMESSQPGHMFLADLREKKLLDDQSSSGISVRVRGGTDQTEV